MDDKRELEIYRKLLGRMSIAIATQNNKMITQSLQGIRDWGYAHSNSTGDNDHDERYRIRSVENLGKIGGIQK